MELTEIIKTLRGDRTQEQLAQELGVTKQAVSQWESGETKPGPKMMELLGIQPQYVLQSKR